MLTTRPRGPGGAAASATQAAEVRPLSLADGPHD